MCRRLGFDLGRYCSLGHDGKVARLPLGLRWLGNRVDLSHNCSICLPAAKVSAAAVEQAWDLILTAPTWHYPGAFDRSGVLPALRLELGPRVPEGKRAVENEPARCRIEVGREVAQARELHGHDVPTYTVMTILPRVCPVSR